jgi:hypothetical protein
MFNKFLINSLFSGLLCITATVMAEEVEPEQPPWFQVELIFFEPVESPPTGEVWRETATEAIAERQVTELAPPLQPNVIQDNPGITPRAFQLLNPSDFSMGDLAQQLLNNKRYRILSHIAWRQPTLELASSQAVHVHNELMQEEALVPVPASNEPLLLNNLPDPLEQPEVANRQKRFDGTVTVSLSRYLHLKADITYYNPEVYLAEQIAQQNVDAPTIEHFKLFESRRMRSKEIHYLDHPYFGIIALITRYERPQEGPPLVNQ